MKNIINRILSADFWKSSFVHGLLMAILGAISAPILAWAQALQDGTVFQFPGVGHILGMAIAAAVLYIIKNLLAGSSKAIEAK